MFIRIIQLLRRNKLKRILFSSACLILLSSYPIYKNYINGEAITTYSRHRAIIENRSEFYNPWQYRILCPLIIEGAKFIYDNTVDKVFPIEEKIHFQFNETSTPTPDTKRFISEIRQPQVIKYLIIFLSFRFIENLLIFIFAFSLFSYFIKNNWLIFGALVLMSWAMGNAVSASDLTFNTYLDILLYLITACIIVFRANPWFILLISIVGAFNRETSIMIPYLFYISAIDLHQFKKGLRLSKIKLPSARTFLIASTSFMAYLMIFILIRIYYGYQPQTEWKVPAGLPMLKLNLFSFVSVKCYFEMFGAFSVLPLVCLLKFKSCSRILQLWFIAIVPIWFFVHFYSVVAYQSRLFLMPTFLIFIPMFLEVIERSGWADQWKTLPFQPKRVGSSDI